MERKELIEMCKSRREGLNLSQSQLATILGVTTPRISEFENNKSSIKYDDLLSILKAL